MWWKFSLNRSNLALDHIKVLFVGDQIILGIWIIWWSYGEQVQEQLLLRTVVMGLSVNYFRNLFERRWLNFGKCILLTVIYYSNYITMSFESVTNAIILHGWNFIQISDWLTEQYTSIKVSLDIFIYIKTVYYDLL